MKHTRRDILRKASALGALAVGASGVAAAADCSGVEEWSSSATYTGGDQAVYDGSLWEAKWWTQGDEPGASEWGPWEEVGSCSGDGGGDDGGDGDDGDGDDGGGGETVDCSGVAAWDEKAIYDEGDQAVHAGTLWEANWWVQGKTPGDSGQYGPWTEIGTCKAETGLKPSISTSTFVQPGESVEFDGSDSSGLIESYEWDFDGDGTVDATGKVVTHTYESTGEYTVTLTVGDGEGNTNSTSVTVTVSNETGFPENVFAPYVDVLLESQDPLVESVEKAGTRHFLLAFVVADTDDDPAWGGTVKVGADSPNLDIGSQISDLREKRGGDVIVSFGGLQGTYLAETTDSAEELKNKYAKVVEEYDLQFLDFDEEKLVRSESGREKVALRNKALVLLKEEYPDLTLSYTLPALPSGLPSHSTNNILFALEDAAERGLEIDLVNPMTMNYGSEYDLNGETVIECAKSIHDQLGDLWPEKSAEERWQMIGLTPMIGQNDVDSNVFYPEDARQVQQWASEQNIRLLSFWELVRDNGEGDRLFNNTLIDSEPYEFSEIFTDFTTE
ncbi:PKD domain-containing protein [Halorhabdus rudnickae]|uniref:PKD domain-containing protein n=1 Tax=Halorhabdus rudnickae TaxID=1775544 RepID=UPI00108359BA|nr:PKD domain-containing protein [Halorhabdus rudnickae]